MTLENLKNKPLVEAIFEIRWQTDQSPQLVSDPNTQLMLGRLFDRISSTYPKYEQLPFAAIPDQMAEGVIKHRFRSEKGWPLVQLGSGILTVNDTENYLWQDFKNKVLNVVEQLYIVYPNQEQFRTSNLILKYIDAVDINSDDDIYGFLKEKMQLNLSLNDLLFQNTSINKKPIQLDMSFSFNCDQPKGIMSFRLFKGQKTDDTGKIISDALIWETIIQSNEEHLPPIPLQLSQWLEEAHSITHNWFFTLVDGDLLRSFES